MIDPDLAARTDDEIAALIAAGRCDDAIYERALAPISNETVDAMLGSPNTPGRWLLAMVDLADAQSITLMESDWGWDLMQAAIEHPNFPEALAERFAASPSARLRALVTQARTLPEHLRQRLAADPDPHVAYMAGHRA